MSFLQYYSCIESSWLFSVLCYLLLLCLSYLVLSSLFSRFLAVFRALFFTLLVISFVPPSFLTPGSVLIFLIHLPTSFSHPFLSADSFFLPFIFYLFGLLLRVRQCNSPSFIFFLSSSNFVLCFFHGCYTTWKWKCFCTFFAMATLTNYASGIVFKLLSWWLTCCYKGLCSLIETNYLKANKQFTHYPKQVIHLIRYGLGRHLPVLGNYWYPYYAYAGSRYLYH